MAGQDWWSEAPVIGGGAPAPVASGFPGVIPGRPKPVDPYKARDQELQEQAAARAAEQFRITQEREEKRDTRAQAKDAQGTVEQGKAASFLTRGIQAEKDYGALGVVKPRSLPGQAFADAYPNAANVFLNDSDRQRAEQSERAFIAAILRYDSGAAIPPQEFVTQGQIYFPRPGDEPAVIEQKAQARRVALEGLKSASGPAGSTIELPDYAAPKTTERDGGLYDDKGNYLGLAGSVTDTSAAPPPEPDGGLTLDQFGRGIAQGAGDLVEGVGDVAGIVVNPISTVLGRSMGYDGFTADFGKSLREGVGLPDNPNPIASAINKGGVGALTGSLIGRVASTLASPGAVQGALSMFGRTPGRDMLAGAGAGGGGEVGREVGGTPGQVAGTLIGGVAGFGGGGALSRIGTPRTPSPLLKNADDLGVTMMPADVGGTGTRMATGALGRTLGGIPIAEGAKRSIDSAAGARGRIAGSIGEATDNAGAGQAVKRGFSQWEKSSERRGGELFEKVSVPAGEQVKLGQTRGALAEVTKGMQSNPALSRLWANHPRLRATLEALTPTDVAPEGRQAFTEASDRLSALLRTKEAEIGSVPGPHRTTNLDDQIAAARRDLADAQTKAGAQPEGGQLSWEDMKRFRSIVGEIIGQPGVTRDGSDIAALRKLYGAVTADMEVTAAHTGPKALQEFRRANQYWRGRESRIDEVFSALLGKDGNRSDEAVFKQINTWAKGEGGDFSRIARTIRSMPDDEANTVRSTIVQRMGMAKPANQDAGGEVFSPALFSTEWRGMSNRAKNVLFPNAQHRSDLEKLAGITDGMKRANEYQNFSNTSLGVNLTGQGALAFAAPVTTAILTGLQFAGGKLLASPKFARIVASSAQLPERTAVQRVSEQLSALARREPLIANDVKAVQQYVVEQLGKSPGKAAAEEPADSRREPPQR